MIGIRRAGHVSFKRGALMVLSMYSLFFVAAPLLVPLFLEGPVNIELPAWVSACSLIVFVLAWAGLWEDMGAADERRRLQAKAAEAGTGRDEQPSAGNHKGLADLTCSMVETSTETAGSTPSTPNRWCKHS